MIWVLFLLAISLVSFLLTVRSMRFYRERPNHLKNYSLFLIQNPANLKQEVLNRICQRLVKKNNIVSFEKLTRANRQALVVYGPQEVLSEEASELNLIELEDYSKKLSHFVSCWEIGEKKTGDKTYREDKIDLVLDNLTDQEQIWWQIIVSPGNYNLNTSMRILIESPNPHQVNNLNYQVLSELERVGLSFLPQIYSIYQLIKFYQERALGGGVFHQNDYITPMDIKSLANILRT